MEWLGGTFSRCLGKLLHEAILCLSTNIQPVCPTGSGTSKKLAKRNAAAKMLSRIHDVPVDLRSSHETEPEDDTFIMVRQQPVDGLSETILLLCSLPDRSSLQISVCS